MACVIGRYSSRVTWSALSSRRNALNLLRFGLASLVLVSHSWPLTGAGEDPAFGGRTLGSWCVAGFFCLSGYLIAGSRVRTTWWGYLWRRALRIFPGLWVAILITVFVFAPIASHFGGQGEWSWSDGGKYLAENALLWAQDQSIGESLSGAQYPDAWNGSLWTLFYEFAAYVVVGALLSFAVIRRFGTTVLLATWLLLCVTQPFIHEHIALALARHAVDLAPFFVAGSFFAMASGRLPLNGIGAVLALLLVVACLALDSANTGWLAMPYGYLLLWCGAALPIRAFHKDDPSYGMYVYAFPIQQLTEIFIRPSTPWIMIAVALPATFAVASLSWRIVEQPVMSLKRIVR